MQYAPDESRGIPFFDRPTPEAFWGFPHAKRLALARNAGYGSIRENEFADFAVHAVKSNHLGSEIGDLLVEYLDSLGRRWPQEMPTDGDVWFWGNKGFETLWLLVLKVPEEYGWYIAQQLPIQRWTSEQEGDQVPDWIAEQMRGLPLREFLKRRGVIRDKLRRDILFSADFGEEDKIAALSGPLRLSGGQFAQVVKDPALLKLCNVADADAFTAEQWKALSEVEGVRDNARRSLRILSRRRGERSEGLLLGYSLTESSV